MTTEPTTTRPPFSAEAATLRWAASRIESMPGAGPSITGALREWAALLDAAAADAPSRPVAAVPAPLQGADPTGPQEFATGGVVASGDLAMPEPAACEYPWPPSARDQEYLSNGIDVHGNPVGEAPLDGDPTGDHLDATGKVAWSELGLRLPDPWADTVLPESAFGAVTECEYVPRAALTAERERADKAEAERDEIQSKHDAYAFRAANTLVAEREAHKHTRQREEAYAMLTEAAMNSFGQALNAVPHDVNQAASWRDHLARYQRRLAELRAEPEEAQS